MAPRAYWKGYLRLSLVTCPIELFPATSQSEKTHFHQINAKTGHRLRQRMVDEETGKVVDTEHKGRGYEARAVTWRSTRKPAVETGGVMLVDIDSLCRLARSTTLPDRLHYIVRTARWPRQLCRNSGCHERQGTSAFLHRHGKPRVHHRPEPPRQGILNDAAL
jgi:hypothetical protein